MKRLDLWLIEKHEKFAHWFQRGTGLTNFWLARLLWPGTSIGMIIFGVIVTFVTKRNITFPFFLLAGALFIVCYPRLLQLCKAMESHYDGGGSSAHSVTLLFREAWPIRLAVSFIICHGVSLVGFITVGQASTLQIMTLFFVVTWISQISVFYFLACVPLPPARQLVMITSPAS